MNVTFRKPPGQADVVNGVRVPYAKPRRGKRWGWYLLLLVVGSPVLWFIGASVYRAVTVTAPGYVALDHLDVTAVRTGVVTEVRVELGAHVRAGQLVTVLRDPELDARRAAISAQLHALGAPLAGARIPAGTADIAALDDARVARAAHQLAVFERLAAAGAATAPDVAAAQAQLDAARADLLNARAAVSGGTPATPGNVAEAASLRGAIAGIDAQRSALRARVPRDGDVVAVPATVGDTVTAGEALVTVAIGGLPHIVAFVEPRDVQALSIGRGATVTLPNGERHRAHVVRVARLAHPIPSTFVSPLASRPDAVEVTLRLDTALPSAGAVDGLPVSVHVDGLRL